MVTPVSAEQLDARLGYAFKDSSLRLLALTHPSAYSSPETNMDYERLEFLGDAVLELVVTEFLYHKLSSAPEGLMTQLRSRVVSRASFAKIAHSLHLSDFVILGKGEEQSGGRKRDSNLSNTFEAIFGAIFLDSDFETSKCVALTLLKQALTDVSENPKDVNPKGDLQIILQKIYPETPLYATQQIGEGIGVTFTATVTWKGKILGEGSGSSKHRAEVQAAQQALNNQSWLTK